MREEEKKYQHYTIKRSHKSMFSSENDLYEEVFEIFERKRVLVFFNFSSTLLNQKSPVQMVLVAPRWDEQQQQTLRLLD